jgi:hypothetical protein
MLYITPATSLRPKIRYIVEDVAEWEYA